MNLRTQGYAVRDIAKRLKKSTNTICNLNKKYFKEILDIRNAKLEELQKIIIEQKQDRLDFLKEQLLILKERINHSEVLMRYDNMVKLALKISDSLNKCERDMLLNRITDNTLNNNVIGTEDHNNEENKEVNTENEISDNKITDLK